MSKSCLSTSKDKQSVVPLSVVDVSKQVTPGNFSPSIKTPSLGKVSSLSPTPLSFFVKFMPIISHLSFLFIIANQSILVKIIFRQPKIKNFQQFLCNMPYKKQEQTGTFLTFIFHTKRKKGSKRYRSGTFRNIFRL